jgi:electron transfer flavoprotein alpha subunit
MTILVFIEQRDSNIKKASLESLRTASTLAAELGGNVAAVVLGPSAEALDYLGGYGASKVIHVNDERLAVYATAAFASALKHVMASEQAEILILAATAMGKDLAPRLSAGMEAGVATDLTALRIEDGEIIATRPVYAGKAYIEVSISSRCKIFSLRPNVFSAGASSGQLCPVETMACDITDADFRAKVIGTTVASGKLDVSEANVIVSGGRGMQGPEHWHIIEELAATLGAATGASRAVVDAGWRPHGEQVGQTGKTVSPTLYVACGISGAVQHLAGMSSSKCIVAVNKDKDAPIFSIADYGIVGDVFEILPALNHELKQHAGA